MKKTLVLIFFFLPALLRVVAHPFYVSVTEIEIKEGQVQIAVKIFMDDLENALMETGKPNLYLGEKNEHTSSLEYIKSYIEPRFKVSLNQEEIGLKCIGKEIENDAVWVYYEGQYDKEVNQVDVLNSILVEHFEGQSNIVHYKHKGETKSLILSKSQKRDKLEL